MKILIVDGYNTINKIPRLKRRMEGSLQEARRLLMQLVREYKRKKGMAELYVVFDGKAESGPESLYHPPEQIFTSKGKADQKIVRLARKYSPDHRVVVVSDDNFVRNNSRAHRARVISIAEFYSAVKKKKTGKDKEEERKISPGDALKITEELKKHWRI